MSLTNGSIRARLIEMLEANHGVIGYESVLLVRDFIEREKIRPHAVIEVLSELGRENYRLKDGPSCRICPTMQLTFCDRFTLELWAQKHLQTGGIKCVAGGL
jgi:hypothetical protein